MSVYKTTVYSRYAYIAFRENSHVSVAAQLIRNNFQIHKTLCNQVKIIKKKEIMLKTESRMFIFSCAFANMTSLVTSFVFRI